MGELKHNRSLIYNTVQVLLGSKKSAKDTQRESGSRAGYNVEIVKINTLFS